DGAERTQDDAVLAHGTANARADGGLVWVLGAGRTVLDELDSNHEPALADLADVGQGGDLLLEEAGQGGDRDLQALEDLVAREDVEGGEGGGAGERVGGVGVAVEEGAPVGVSAEEGLVDAIGDQRRGEREVAGGDALGDAEEVGRDPFLLACEEGAGAAEAGGDLVGDEEDVVGATERGGLAEVAGRLDEHAGSTLDQRLEDKRGDLVAVLVERAGERAEAEVAAGGRLRRLAAA